MIPTSNLKHEMKRINLPGAVHSSNIWGPRPGGGHLLGQRLPFQMWKRAAHCPAARSAVSTQQGRHSDILPDPLHTDSTQPSKSSKSICELEVQRHYSDPFIPCFKSCAYLLFISFPDSSLSGEEVLLLLATGSLEEESRESVEIWWVPVLAISRWREWALWHSWESSKWVWVVWVLLLRATPSGWVRSSGAELESPNLLSRDSVTKDAAVSCFLDGETGSASELCFTVFRLCALIRDQVVEWKLSASNQNFTKCSILRSSINWRKYGRTIASRKTCSRVFERLDLVSWVW